MGARTCSTMPDPNTCAKSGRAGGGGQLVGSARRYAEKCASTPLGLNSAPHGQARSAHAPELASMLMALQPSLASQAAWRGG